MSLLPVTLGSSFLLLLSQLCANVEALGRVENQHSKILRHYNFATNYWSQACGHLLGRSFSDDKSFQISYKEYLELMDAEFVSLKELSNSPQARKNVSILIHLCQDSLDEMINLPQAAGTGSISSLSNLNRMPRILAKLYFLPGKVEQILEKEWKELNKFRSQQDQQTQWVKVSVLVFFAANVLVALALSVFFARRISSRLQVLTRNAGCLASLQGTLSKVGGTDEIAYLGTVIEEASAKLLAASEHRRSIFGMVAHDMRSPLNAAVLCLDIIIETHSSIQDQSKNELEHARNKMTGIVNEVNAILKLEQEKQQQGETLDANLPSLQMGLKTGNRDEVASREQASNHEQTSNREQASNHEQTSNREQAVDQEQTVSHEQASNREQASNHEQASNREQAVDQEQTVSQDQKFNRDPKLNRDPISNQDQTGTGEVKKDAAGSTAAIAGPAAAIAGTTHSLNRLSVHKTTKSPLKFLFELFFAPRILHKGIWLILIPLLMQSAFLIMLDRQLNQSKQLVKVERQLGQLTMNVNLIFLDSLKASVSEAIYFASMDTNALKKTEENYLQVKDRLTEIEKSSLLKDQEWRALLKSWRKIVREHLAEVRNGQSRATSLGSLSDKIKAYKPLKAKTVKIRNRTAAKFEKEAEHIRNLEREQSKSRKRVEEILNWGLLANLILTLTLLLLFNRNISRRLKMLVENAHCLGQAKYLNKKVDGKDELAYLDLMLHHTQQELLKAAKERGDLMSVIAANMERPLRSAKAELEEFRLREQEQLNPRMQKQLTRADHNINRVLLLISDLLSMETIESGKVSLDLTLCRLNEIAEESMSVVASLAGQKEIQLLSQCDDSTFEADKARVIQTMVNLLSNAIKFSPAGSKVTIKSVKETEYLRICIQDEGPGMDAETKSRVFERFFQAESKEKKQGFGLGLAICQLIVNSHHGKLGVDSEPGKGSCFWFELPFKQERILTQNR